VSFQRTGLRRWTGRADHFSSTLPKVTLTYTTGDGKAKTQDLLVPAASRSTVHPADILGTGDDPGHDFSTRVQCTNGQEMIAERPMYFNFKSMWSGGSCVIGQ